MSEQPSTTTVTSASAPKGGTYIWGTGRRKTAVARVRIRPGSGQIRVNNREFKDFFPLEVLQNTCLAPLRAADMVGKLDVFIRVRGGGPTGQAGAASLGIARALVRYDSATEPALRDGQYLTRDSREVERKKYGQAGARRRFQFSKR
ncbi:MAG: 30S ribosomal protein S9 [Phycisphaerae bacterium]|nr:30S ribosomal protein S9 [Phycisphaerae bacterium]